MKIIVSVLFCLIFILPNIGQTQLSCQETFEDYAKVYAQGGWFLNTYNPDQKFIWPEGFTAEDSILYRGEDFLPIEDSRTILNYQGKAVLRFPWVEYFGNKYTLPLFGGFVSDSVYIFYIHTHWVNAPNTLYILSKHNLVWIVDSINIPQKNKGGKFEFMEIIKITDDNQLIFRLTSGKLVDKFEESIVILNPLTKTYFAVGRVTNGNFRTYYNK